MAKKRIDRVRVRMAPSPTGYLHVGTVRTALFNWLFARHHTGAFIVRSEDTDLERSRKEYEDDILAGFEWLGLKWDEFYRQSDRTKIYAKYIQKLLDAGKAFWCYHSEAELEQERQEQLKGGDLPRHVCNYKNSKSEILNPKPGIIRLVTNENSTRKIAFDDIIKGRIEFEERLLGDISIAKAVDEPLYHLAVVVDDYEMEISHVIRGEDHLANTPKQILIAEALGWESPHFAHLPLLLGEDRSKLSKRHGATSLADYRLQGYLPDALVNFLALLGWSPETTSREILTKNELIEQFSLERVHKAGAIFDVKKLNWMNAQHIKLFNDETLATEATPFIEKYFGEQPRELILKLVPLLRERLEYFDQVKEFHYCFRRPTVQSELLIWKKSDAAGAKRALGLAAQLDWQGAVRDQLDKLATKEFAGDRGAVYWPVRTALSGERFSPDPVELSQILGPEETRARIQAAGDLL